MAMTMATVWPFEHWQCSAGWPKKEEVGAGRIAGRRRKEEEQVKENKL